MNFGWTSDQVKGSEKTESVAADNNSIAYQEELFGKEYIVLYTMRDGVCNTAGYIANFQTMNKNVYVEQFALLNEFLNKKYGEKEAEINWKNPLYQGEVESFGLAISINHLELKNVWKTSFGRVILSLKGDNYKIFLGVGYTTEEAESPYKKVDGKL
jgi:hypothetical protein